MHGAFDCQFTELKEELRGLSARFESVERQNQRIIEGLSIEQRGTLL